MITINLKPDSLPIIISTPRVARVIVKNDDGM